MCEENSQSLKLIPRLRLGIFLIMLMLNRMLRENAVLLPSVDSIMGCVLEMEIDVSRTFYFTPSCIEPSSKNLPSSSNSDVVSVESPYLDKKRERNSSI